MGVAKLGMWPLLSFQIFLLSGCQRSEIVEAQFPLRKEIVIDIDFTNQVASGPGWRQTLIDCSDAESTCFEVEGRFLIGFPRICPASNDSINVAGNIMRLGSPAPHLSWPNGGFVFEKYPKISIGNYTSRNLVYLYTNTESLLQSDVRGERSEEAKLNFVGGPNPFQCQTADGAY